MSSNTQKEQFGFAFAFYRWVLGTLAFLLLAYLLVNLLAQVFGIEAVLNNPVAAGMISLGIFWVLTVLQYRGVLAFLTQWGIGQSTKMYHCAQMGLLPPMLRKVNQYKVPLVLTGIQRSILSVWFFILTILLALASTDDHFNSVFVFTVLSLFILIALPFWLYSRHNKEKHKTIVLPPRVTLAELSKHHFTFSHIRTMYEIRPAKEDYLPFSKQRELVREQQEAARVEEEEYQAQSSKQPVQPEQVVEANEIEYAD